MAIDTAAKRAGVAHVKRAGKGVVPNNLVTDGVERAAVAWNYGGNAFSPPPAVVDVTDSAPVLGEEFHQRPSLGEVWG